jgi:hypothetical protein
LETLIAYLPALACGAMMFFCIRHMFMGSKQDAQQGHDQTPNEEIAELREEIARLRAEQALRAGDADEESLTR